MHLTHSRKFLIGILLVQAAILMMAFSWFSGKLSRYQLDREARIFDVTTNLQLSELLADPGNRLSDALLGTLRHVSKIEGMFGTCLFNENRESVFCIPEFLQELEWDPIADRAKATLVADFELNVDDTAMLYDKPGQVLRMDIPLKGRADENIAYLRFYRDGTEFAAALRAQKLILWLLAVLAILLTGSITSFLFTTYARRLERSEEILRAKNQELLNAQRHLLLSTQMTAVGSMTAHLIHDLKSYANLITGCLAAIRQEPEGNGKTLAEAERISREMATRIREFLTLLRNNSSDFQSLYTPGEIMTILRQKVEPVAEKAQLQVNMDNRAADFSIDFRKGNFLILILQNLLHNAIESTAAAREVRLEISSENGRACFRVIDQGEGIPEDEQAGLFLPQHSLKEGGTGLGLALCAQMAYHIGAEIDLLSSGPEGSCFRVKLPIENPESS